MASSQFSEMLRPASRRHGGGSTDDQKTKQKQKQTPVRGLMTRGVTTEVVTGSGGSAEERGVRVVEGIGGTIRKWVLGRGERQDEMRSLSPFYVATRVLRASASSAEAALGLLGESAGRRTPKERLLRAQSRLKGLPRTGDGHPPKNGSYTGCEHS